MAAEPFACGMAKSSIEDRPAMSVPRKNMMAR
jgi:hypothetical protein